MKKIKYTFLALLTSLCLSSRANAMWPDFTPVIPIAPQFCPMCVAPSIITAISYYQQASKIKDTLEKYTDMTQLKQMAVSYAAGMGKTAFNNWRQKENTKQRVVSYARTIEDSNIAEEDSEESVKNAFMKLFLQYPSQKTKTKNAYKKMGEQLKIDTTLEMYLTAVAMEKELYGDDTKEDKNKKLEDLGMLKQIDLIESCLVEGKDCEIVGLTSCQEEKKSSSDDTNEDKVCFWNSALQAEQLYDTIMRYNLFLVAMHAQYQAVRGINVMVRIKEYEKPEDSKDGEDKKDKTSFIFNQHLMPHINIAGNMLQAEVAFADMTTQTNSDDAEFQAYEENLANKENVIDGNFEDANNPDSFTAVLDERQEDVKSMEILAQARKDLNQAQKIHNLKKTLPEFRKVFEDYEQIQEKMKEAALILQSSGECIVNMMSPYYKNAQEVWFGGNCIYYRDGYISCHYNPEKNADNEGDSEGYFDIICPGDLEHSCYLEEVRSGNMSGGVAKYLISLYMAAKDEDAAGETEAFVDVTEHQAEGEYTSRANIITGGKEAEVSEGEDDLYVTSRDSDETVNVDEMTTQTSEVNSDEAPSNLKNQEKGDEEKEQARKDGIIRWVLGADVSKELALDLDTGKNDWGERIGKFPLWNDEIFYYDQYIDGKYDNIEEYIREMSYAEVLLKVAENLNPIYPYKTEADPMGGIMISAEQQRRNTAEALKEFADTLKQIKEEKLKELKKEDSEQQDTKQQGSGQPNRKQKAEDMSFSDIEMLKIEQEIEASIERLKAVRDKYEEKRKTKLEELKQWYKIMDEANTHISEANSEYNNANETIKKGDATTPEATEGLEYSEEIYADRELSSESPQNTEFDGTRTDNEKNSAEAAKIQKQAEAKAQSYEKILKKAEEKIASIKEELEAMRIEYVKDMSNAETDERGSFTTFVDEMRAARNINAVEVAISKIPLLNFSAQLVQCIRSYALEKVAEAKTEIQTMKEDKSLYYVENAADVQKIHENMISQITEIPLEKLAECTVLNVFGDIGDDMPESLAPALNIFADICKEDFCTTEDGEFFVGAIGLPRDFAAPKSPLNFNSAPLREVLHFDIIDFNNMDKYYKSKDEIDSNKKVYTSVESVLKFFGIDIFASEDDEMENTGEEQEETSTVPEIWKYILKPHAFVQKEIDWIPLLSNEDEENQEISNTSLPVPSILGGLFSKEVEIPLSEQDKAVLRAGNLPCILNEKYVIDVRSGKDGYMYFYSLSKVPEKSESNKEQVTDDSGDVENGMKKTDDDIYKQMPQCQGLSLESKRGKVVIYDKELGQGFEVKEVSNEEIKPSEGSELGQLLAFVVDEETEKNFLLKIKMFPQEIKRKSMPHRLTFNQQLLNAINRIVKTEDLTDDDEAARFYMAQRILYERNQFGDYLDQVENETITADSLEKVKKQIGDIMLQLKEVIGAGDFEITEDFSLTNEKDYEGVSESLDTEKETYIDLATQKLDTIPVNENTSKSVSSKLEKLLHTIEVLQTDGEEQVAVNGDEDLDELEEKIKNSQADTAVVDKFKEASEKEQERQNRHIRQPYCASYLQ